jgi:hypothetical protein
VVRPPPFDRAEDDGGAAGDSRDLVPREYLLGRLGHLGRRLEELHQAEIQRIAEERRETWILVLALSVVLVFCFAAFFMNQMEVRELRSGLEEELERRSTQTVSAIEDTIDGLQLEKLPRLQASLERMLREKDTRDQRGFEDVLDEVRRQGATASQRLDDRIRALEERLEAALRLARETRAPGEDAEAGAPGGGTAGTSVARGSGE